MRDGTVRENRSLAPDAAPTQRAFAAEYVRLF